MESQCRRDALVRHMRALDMAAMMGGPGTRGLVQAMAAAVHAALADQAGCVWVHMPWHTCCCCVLQ